MTIYNTQVEVFENPSPYYYHGGGGHTQFSLKRGTGPCKKSTFTSCYKESILSKICSRPALRFIYSINLDKSPCVRMVDIFHHLEKIPSRNTIQCEICSPVFVYLHFVRMASGHPKPQQLPYLILFKL